MLITKKYQDKKIAVYGLGTTGLSAVKLFKSLKAQPICWDDDSLARKKINNLGFNVDKFWLKKFKKIDKILISPGININNCKLKKFLKKNLNKIITDLDLFFEIYKKNLIISITGTNGKSTTCKIIEKILKTASYKVYTVGNIGNPILSIKNYKKKSIFIIEVSSYQLEYSKTFRSNHAAILNISSDHLERHKNIQNYKNIKSKIFFAQKKTDYSYLNFLDKNSKSIAKRVKKNKIKSKIVFVNRNNYKNLLSKINNNYFKSNGNIDNLSFAYEIAKKLKIKDKVLIKAINEFKGLPHRQEIVFSNKKLLCINDSKATSFDASFQSLSNYNKIYWIVGGLPKKNDKFKLEKVKKNIVKAYIVGKKTSFFKTQIKNKLSYKISKKISHAINDIFSDIKLNKNEKSTILLSPAAASYDQFINFEKRGDYFKKILEKKNKKRTYV